MSLVNEKNLVSNGYCFKCANHGFLDKVCPACGREPTRVSMNFDVRKDTEEFVKKVSVAGIPALYQGVMWDAEILRDSKREKERDISFDNFVKQLSKINDIFVSGLLPQKSAIIIAPAGYSKMVFAYSCLQRALDNGFSIAPIFDTVEIKRFLTLAGDNPNHKLYDSISYEDYIMADVLFATVTKLPSREWAYEALEELIDRRARKGLSTFVLSRFSLMDISKRDKSNQFSAIATSVSTDSLKYPAVIRYRELIDHVEEC